MTNKSKHWANQNERGNRLVLNITRCLVKYCPQWLLKPVVAVVVLYYFISSKAARRHVSAYQVNLQQRFPKLQAALNSPFAVWQQFYAFATSITDRFSVWQGKISYQDLIVHDEDNLYADINTPKPGAIGQIFICSHLGNIEVCRALVREREGFELNILIHSAHAVEFNKALQQAGASQIRLIQVTQLDAELMMQLHQRISNGEWIAIAADRVPVRGEKTIAAEFLGKMALWPQGPWLLAGLLKAPVNTIFCIKEQGQYHLYLRRFVDAIPWRRQERSAAIAECVTRYAQVLEQRCAQSPLQWFNFYDFWNQHDSSK